MMVIGANQFNLNPNISGNFNQGLQLAQNQQDRQLLQNQAKQNSGNQQKIQQLTRIAIDPNNPDALRARREIMAIDPGFSDKLGKSLGALNQESRSRMAQDAIAAQSMTFEQQTAFLARRADQIDASGGDSSDTRRAIEASPEERQTILGVASLAALDTKDALSHQLAVGKEGRLTEKGEFDRSAKLTDQDISRDRNAASQANANAQLSIAQANFDSNQANREFTRQ
jgi:hypothetical protein